MKASSFYYGSEVNLETVWLKRIDCVVQYEIENQMVDFHGLFQLLNTSVGNHEFRRTEPPDASRGTIDRRCPPPSSLLVLNFCCTWDGQTVGLN